MLVFWVGRLGYPAIAYLLKTGVIQYEPAVARWLKNVRWKDINTKHKNNYAAAIDEVRAQVAKHGHDLDELDLELADIARQLDGLGLNKPAKRPRPPRGY